MFKSLYAKAGVFAVIIASLSLTACKSLKSAFKEPVVSLHSVELMDIDFTGLVLLCKVDVENRSPVSIPFPEVDWELFINTNSFVKGIIKPHGSIKARETTTVDVPVHLKYLDVFNTFNSLRGSNKADYKVVLDTKFTLPVIGDKNWHFEHTGTFPVLHLPKLSFRGLSLKNLSLTRIDLELSWEIENTNSFAMSIKDFSYSLAVNNSQWSSGKAGNARIEAGKKTIVPLDFSISSLSMVRDITEIVTRGTDISYHCSGNLSLGMAMQGLADWHAPFNFSGHTKLRK
jgi:LEA14-like dessication related protein